MAALHRRCVLVACGSFNPPTYAHLRMMEVAREALALKGVSVVDAIFSPVSCAYVRKPHLVADVHRRKMLELATANSFMRVDDWEQRRGVWSRTVEVLDHFRSEARHRFNDDNVDCILVCGGDLVDSFSKMLESGPLWAPADVSRITTDFGLIVLARHGSTPRETLGAIGQLAREKVFVIEETLFPNQISSTLLRQAIAEDRSIRFCTKDGVVDYIEEHGLYSCGYANRINGAGPIERARNGAAVRTRNGATNGAAHRNGHSNGHGANGHSNGTSNGTNGNTNGTSNGANGHSNGTANGHGNH